MTLTDFLLARINEDETVARMAIDPARPGMHWRWTTPDDVGDPAGLHWLRTVEEFPTTSGVGPLPAFPIGYEVTAEPSRGMDHIARHDPARVLAECEAKRRIVEMHYLMDGGDPDSFPYVAEDGRTVWPGCVICHGDWTPRRLGCDTIRTLAAVYADHPDYRDEWAV